MKSSSKKWLFGTVLMLAVAGSAAYWFFNKGTKVEYTTQALTRGDIDSVVSATGTCNAVVSVQVGSQVSGNIKEIHADYNAKVSRGEVVAVIDPAPFQAKVDQAKANLESARASVMNSQAQLKKGEADIASATANIANQKANVVRAQSAVTDAKNKLDRRKEMFEQKVISREDRDTAQATYDQAVAQLEAAQAQLKASESQLESVKAQQDVARAQLTTAQSQVKQQQANLEQAMLDLSHTQIQAPVDGTVIARNMDVGQTVAASFSAPTIFQIAQDLTKMQVDTNIDESDIARIQLGQPATFSVDAYPGQTFRGEVFQIRRAPINVQNVITYDVVVRVDNPDLKLFPGMTANVRILTERARNVLRLPTAALRVRMDNVPVNSKGKDGSKQVTGGNNSGTVFADEKGSDASKGGGTETAGQNGRGGRGGFGGGGQGGRGGFGGNGGFGGGRAGGRGAGGTQFGTVYLLGADGKPYGERVRLGIGDGSFTAILGNNLKEGDKVITAVIGGETTKQTQGGFPGQNQKGGFKGRGGGFF